MELWTPNIWWAPTVRRTLHILHTVHTNSEVSAVAPCILTMRKLSCLRICRKHARVLCRTSKPVFLTTVLDGSFWIQKNPRSSEPLNAARVPSARCPLLALKHTVHIACEVEASTHLAVILSVLSGHWFLVRDRQRWPACIQGNANLLVITANALRNNYTNCNVISSNWSMTARM